MKKILFSILLGLIISVSAYSQNHSYVGLSSYFTYMPHLYHTSSYGVVVEKSLSKYFNIVTGYNVERFNEDFYHSKYADIPLYLKFTNPIVDISLGLDMYNYIETSGFSNVYSKKNDYMIGGGFILSKDFWLGNKVVFEPTINFYFNNPAYNGFFRGGYGLKLKYAL